MTGLRGITRVAAAAFIALALSSCAMNAQQQPGQAPVQQQSGQGKPSTDSGAITQGQFERDPNLPGEYSPGGLKITWNQTSGDFTQPIISIETNPVSPVGAQYLGWNDEGSWLSGMDGKIYTWQLKSNTLTERYRGFKAIPTDVLVSLRNSAGKQRWLAMQGIKSGPQEPQQPVQVASNPPPPGNISADDARNAIGQLGAGQGAPRFTTPSGSHSATSASLKGNILTLTMADGTRQALKVERPPTPAAAASGDITGTWLAFDANKLVVVRGDGTATVTDMDARLRASFEQIKKLVGGQK
jgi:hypothetical protein